MNMTIHGGSHHHYDYISQGYEAILTNITTSTSSPITTSATATRVSLGSNHQPPEPELELQVLRPVITSSCYQVS
jgi:hypothetical protein